MATKKKSKAAKKKSKARKKPTRKKPAPRKSNWQKELDAGKIEAVPNPPTLSTDAVVLAECVSSLATMVLAHERMMMKTNDRSEATDAMMGVLVKCRRILRP